MNEVKTINLPFNMDQITVDAYTGIYQVKIGNACYQGKLDKSFIVQDAIVCYPDKIAYFINEDFKHKMQDLVNRIYGDL